VRTFQVIEKFVCDKTLHAGDHKQLRPSVAVYQLAKDYNFDISLFERMVNRDENQCVTLGVQHRMAPAIASLITPAIYTNLRNAANVKLYDDIKGCPNRVYFIDHRFYETKTV
jgi:superfamily I DNA and/or RNA helicase